MRNMLLIAGGGTLGRYTAKTLLENGCAVDIICLEEYVSDNDKLRFFKETANLAYLEKFLKNRYYDGIVNFIHYVDVEEYKAIHALLTKKTDHLIFLSSYRVYADLQHPITETAPQLFDVVEDEVFLNTEDYAVPKSKCERFITQESNTSNWTIVRPVISFSDKRFDIVTVNRRAVIDCAEKGVAFLLPSAAKNLTAGLDWAGNSGKLIAGLLMTDKSLGEAYTVSSAQNLTWGEIADIYTELVGTKFEWVDTETYFKEQHKCDEIPYILKYDRLFDRKTDNSKILEATGFSKDDFLSVKDGLKIELEHLKKEGGKFLL